MKAIFSLLVFTSLLQATEVAHYSVMCSEDIHTVRTQVINNTHEDESLSMQVKTEYIRTLVVFTFCGERCIGTKFIFYFGEVTYYVEKDSNGRITSLDLDREEFRPDEPLPDEA